MQNAQPDEGGEGGQPFLILISLVFYDYWTPQYVILLGISAVANYALGLWIAQTIDAGQDRRRVLLVTLGVVGNLATLGYYKYANFLVDTLDALLGTGFAIERIILPLAISFYTFQQICYIVDIGRARSGPAGSCLMCRLPCSFRI